MQNAAYAARVLTLYAWSQLNQEAGDEKAATEHLELARQVRNAATDRGIALPAMPAGLGAPPKPAGAEPPATAPADQPADAPANQP